jgi:pyruvate/2-oxoglutarate dehydrogenase complex dihydrolipoamide acyltransferase (E2) component
MGRVSVTVPQLGEGIREVRALAILVEPEQWLSRDEPFAEIETDKATVVIESPVTGVVQEILCRPGDTFQVGGILAWVNGHADAAEPPTDSVERRITSGQYGALRNADASPRQQALLRRIGEATDVSTAPALDAPGWQSARQRLLSRRLRDSHLSMVAASIEMELDWTAVERMRRHFDGALRPTGLELVAWATATAMATHSRFRIQRRTGGAASVSPHVDLGIAVALPDDGLATARIGRADALDFPDFVAKMRASVEAVSSAALSEDVSLVITDMSTLGVISAVPAVVAPAIATLFIGYPDWRPHRTPEGDLDWRRAARLVLAFDHCMINGAGASNFL